MGTIINHFVIVRTADFREAYGWLNAILSGIGLGLLPYILPVHLHEAAHILIPFGVIAVSIISLVIVVAVLYIKDTTQQHMHHFETINKVSRQIMLSLDTERTIALLDATIQETLEADTYLIGLLRDNEIHMDLFYEDGEYLSGAKIPLG